jgi:heat shock protein HslJ
MEFAEAGATVAAPAGEMAATTAKEATLTGQVWAWQSLDMSDGSITAVGNPEQYTVEFLENGTLRLLADCNAGGGTYTTVDGSLTIEAAALTRMACPPGSLSNEYVARLNEVASYVIDGGQLFLNLRLDSGNVVFAPLAVETAHEAEPTPTPTPAPSAAAGQATAIVGSTWEWAGYVDAVERYTVANPESYTITFLADGKYQVQADCNTGGGAYVLDGRNLSIGPAAMTRMACPPGSQDSVFLAHLNAATRYLVAGGSLYLETGEDGMMKFRAAQ